MLAMLLLVASALTSEVGATHAANTQITIARNLDLSSFPNSTGPRRREGANTPKDYGFVRISDGDRFSILSEDDGSWQIGVKILSGARGHYTVCFMDTARNGGSYHVEEPLDVVLTPNGLFRATPSPNAASPCPIIR
ncbi:MAG: hypothetical protein ACYDD1_12265 [Caulobacteraceae bacterium]